MTDPTASNVEFEDPKCPTCSATLVLRAGTDDVIWECPQGHGEFVNLMMMYDTLQQDEIEGLWALASKSPNGPRPCPICGNPMAQVPLPVDDDEDFDNDSSDDRIVTLDVCLEDNGIWFDQGEWAQMPRHHEQTSFGHFFKKFGRKS